MVGFFSGKQERFRFLCDWIEAGLRESFPGIAPGVLHGKACNPRNGQGAFDQECELAVGAAMAWRQAREIEESCAASPAGKPKSSAL